MVSLWEEGCLSDGGGIGGGLCERSRVDYLRRCLLHSWVLRLVNCMCENVGAGGVDG